jgi:GNAT superfamily N-acetyltransferase
LDSVTIRQARPEDAPALGDLLTQLGYPTDAAEIPRRLEKVHARPGTTVLVAEHQGRAVGVVTVHLFSAMHANEPAAWLTALVVDQSVRGKGVGSALVEHAEQWAIQQGARNLALTSALYRKEAHEFYKSRDYEHTGVRLVKKLTPDPGPLTAAPTAALSPTNRQN